MKLIFVASPYAGNVKDNLKYAQGACRFVKDSGHAFFAPHLLYPKVLRNRDQGDRQAGLDMALDMLRRCDELWAFGVVISDEMRIELNEATKLDIPIKHFVLYDNSGKWPRMIQPSWKKAAKLVSA